MILSLMHGVSTTCLRQTEPEVCNVGLFSPVFYFVCHNNV